MQLLRDADRRVREGLLAKARFDEIQKAVGFNFNSRGLLSSPTLSAHCSLFGAVTYDWVHTALQDGCFVVEASLIVNICSSHVEVTSNGCVGVLVASDVDACIIGGRAAGPGPYQQPFCFLAFDAHIPFGVMQGHPRQAPEIPRRSFVAISELQQKQKPGPPSHLRRKTHFARRPIEAQGNVLRVFRPIRHASSLG